MNLSPRRILARYRVDSRRIRFFVFGREVRGLRVMCYIESRVNGKVLTVAVVIDLRATTDGGKLTWVPVKTDSEGPKF